MMNTNRMKTMICGAALFCVAIPVYANAECEANIREMTSRVASAAGISIPKIKFSDTLTKNYGIRALSSFSSRVLTFDRSLCNDLELAVTFTIMHEVGHLMDFEQNPKRYSTGTLSDTVAEAIADENARKISEKMGNNKPLVAHFTEKCEAKGEVEDVGFKERPYDVCARMYRMSVKY